MPEISIYPNPFSDSVTYKITAHFGDSVALKLFDVYGRLLLNFEKQPLCNSETISLNNGIYITSTQVDSSTFNNKIIKEGGTGSIQFKLEIAVTPLLLDELTIYPNPTNSGVNVIIKSSEKRVKISLLDLNGKKLLSKKNNNEIGTIELNLNLSEFKNGAYIIRTESRNGELTRRIVKVS